MFFYTSIPCLICGMVQVQVSTLAEQERKIPGHFPLGRCSAPRRALPESRGSLAAELKDREREGCSSFGLRLIVHEQLAPAVWITSLWSGSRVRVDPLVLTTLGLESWWQPQ